MVVDTTITHPPFTTSLRNRLKGTEVEVQVIPAAVEDDMRTNNEAEVFTVSSTASAHVDNWVAVVCAIVDNSSGPWHNEHHRIYTDSTNGLYHCTDKPPPRITRTVQKSKKGRVCPVKRTGK